MITNALDNFAARRYLDGQWVKARIPKIDLGTLGPKGHVQAVLPNKQKAIQVPMILKILIKSFIVFWK